MKILIIEDEPFAQQELLRLLRQTRIEFELLECLDTIEDSVEWIRNNPVPDLVFLDIQLADGLSFEIFKQVKLEAPVIFTTAYDEYAIKAFELNSVDYLLKPVKLAELETAMGKLASLKEQFSSQGHITDDQLEKVLAMVSGKDYKSRFMVRLGDQIKSIQNDEVAYFKAEDNVVFLFTGAGKKYIIDHTLEQLEDLVDPKQFFRLNRGYLAGVGSIQKVSKYFNSRLVIELDPPADEKVLVSRKRVSSFLEWFDQ